MLMGGGLGRGQQENGAESSIYGDRIAHGSFLALWSLTTTTATTLSNLSLKIFIEHQLFPCTVLGTGVQTKVLEAYNLVVNYLI